MISEAGKSHWREAPENGWNAFCIRRPENQGSRRCESKLGAEKTDEVSWLRQCDQETSGRSLLPLPFVPFWPPRAARSHPHCGLSVSRACLSVRALLVPYLWKPLLLEAHPCPQRLRPSRLARRLGLLFLGQRGVSEFRHLGRPHQSPGAERKAHEGHAHLVLERLLPVTGTGTSGPLLGSPRCPLGKLPLLRLTRPEEVKG